MHLIIISHGISVVACIDFDIELYKIYINFKIEIQRIVVALENIIKKTKTFEKANQASSCLDISFLLSFA